MSQINTNFELLQELRKLIPNIPESGVCRLELTLDGHARPTMTLETVCYKPADDNPAPFETVVKRYRIVELPEGEES